MGYSTDFTGKLLLNKPLTREHKTYLLKFSETRRMQRDEGRIVNRSDPVREAVNLPVGPEGGYFVGSKRFAGQEHTKDIVNYNCPPEGQPSLWCQWIPNEDGTAIVWDQGEKFYCYVKWLQYIIDHFLALWGYELTGEIEWQGEDSSDNGKIIVDNNSIDVYGDPYAD